MKKMLTLTAAALSLCATTAAFAAPLSDIAQGDTTAGYVHYNLDHDTKNDSFYLEHGLSEKVVLGVEHNGFAQPGANREATDVYAQYKLDPHVRLIAGTRDSDSSADGFYYGLGATLNLAPQLDGYMSATTGSHMNEWQAGVSYKMNANTDLTLGYKSLKEDNAATTSGLGLGANYKF